jgi:hypothetical protein
MIGIRSQLSDYADAAMACADTLIGLFDSLDHRDVDGVVERVTIDASFGGMGHPMVGREAIAAGLAMIRHAPPQRHLVTNIRLLGADGQSVSLSAALTVLHVRDGACVVAVMVQSENSFRSVDGSWLLSSHDGTMISPMPPMPPGGPAGP